MKLNPDCIRDVLLYLEDNLYINKNKFSKITLDELKEHFNSEYLDEDILYSVYNLNEVGFIEGRIKDCNDIKIFYCDIENITWNGHQFLNTIRPKSIWEATKSGASKLGIMSMHALSSISMAVANAVITNPTVINEIISNAKF